MKKFTDTKGREWVIDISVFTAKQVKGLLDTDIMLPKAVIPRLADPIFLCDLLYVVCKDQADKLGVSDEEFGRGLKGEVLWNAQNAFTEEYIDFFQNPEVRKNLEELAARMQDATAKMQKVLSKRIAKLDKEVDNAVKEFEKKLDDIGNGSTSLPESLG